MHIVLYEEHALNVEQQRQLVLIKIHGNTCQGQEKNRKKSH